MAALKGGLLAILLPFLVPQGIVQDQVQTQYHQAIAAAPAEGLPAVLRKLDALAGAAASSPFLPYIHEMICRIGILHPGSVPDLAERIKTLKGQSSGNRALAEVVKRSELVQAYYAAAARGAADRAAGALADPALEGNFLQLQARADAALRARNYVQAEALARQVQEADPYSPLLANAHMILGYSALYRGDPKTALRHFQNAYAASALPTVYGNTRDILFTVWRFARPVPSAVGGIFDEVPNVRLALTAPLKEPKALVFNNGKFILVDKEQTLTISPEGKVLDTKPGRKIEDAAVAADGKICFLTEDRIDLGNGSLLPLTATVSGRPKTLSKLRSIAIDDRGDLYMADQDLGLVRGVVSASGAVSLSPVAPLKSRLLRIDSRGNIFALAADEKSIQIYGRDGKPAATVTPGPTLGKEPSIEYFALDSLNHLFILDTNSNSVQAFVITDGRAGLEVQHVGSVLMDQRLQFKNLKVIGVSAAGEVFVAGKNEDNWVWFR
jgi:tetratricopeptide (TPR) repeat protein